MKIVGSSFKINYTDNIDEDFINELNRPEYNLQIWKVDIWKSTVIQGNYEIWRLLIEIEQYIKNFFIIRYFVHFFLFPYQLSGYVRYRSHINALFHAFIRSEIVQGYTSESYVCTFPWIVICFHCTFNLYNYWTRAFYTYFFFYYKKQKIFKSKNLFLITKAKYFLKFNFFFFSKASVKTFGT